jgi:hypothetical protein
MQEESFYSWEYLKTKDVAICMSLFNLALR